MSRKKLKPAQIKFNDGLQLLREANTIIYKECDHIEICVDLCSHITDLEYVSKDLEDFIERYFKYEP